MEDPKEKVELFLQFIEMILEKKNWTIRHLATRIDMPSTAYKWFNRESVPSFENVYKMLKVLGYKEVPYTSTMRAALKSYQIENPIS